MKKGTLFINMFNLGKSSFKLKDRMKSFLIDRSFKQALTNEDID